MQIQRSISYFVFLLLVLQFFLWDINEIENPNDKYQSPEEVFSKNRDIYAQKMKGIHLMESAQGQRLWVLNAKEAESKKEDKDWALKKIKATFYGKNEVMYFVDADYGDINIQTKDINMLGHIDVSTSTGYRFVSTQLHYISKERKILSPQMVNLNGPLDEKGERLSFSGDELMALLDKNEIVLDGNVKARKKLQSKLGILLNSDSAVLSSELNKVQEFKNVDIDYDDKKIKGPLAYLYMNTDTLDIKELIVQGGVSLKDGKNSGNSQNLFMDLLQNRIELTGSPRFFSENEELLGEKIIFHDGGDRIEVQGAKASIQESGNGQVLDSGNE